MILKLVPVVQALLNQPANVGNPYLSFFLPLSALFSLITLACDLIALAWVGMWMGISRPKPIQAFARTLLFAAVIPTLFFCLPNILFDAFWIQWARRNLEREFRRTSVDRFAPLESLRPLGNGPPPATAPPVIAV
jgi:hypothetical protein